jgi:hypothetical protein
MLMRFAASPARAQDSGRDLSSADLQSAAAIGAILQVDAGRYSSADLRNIAAVAARFTTNNVQFPTVRLTIVNARRLSGADLENIAAAGKGCVAFIVDR